MSEAKPFYQSKTLALNAITLLLAVISITEPEMLGIKPETLLWISSVLNIILRLITTGAVSFTAPPSGQ